LQHVDPSLPLPDADARAHSARVVSHIRDDIAQSGGFISLARYIELALYAPGLGYYVAGARKFGADGDFVTGPELTPLYGSALARQIERIIDASGRREILEIGAGSGTLAASLLKAFAVSKWSALRYRILEVSPVLRERQQAMLASEMARTEATVEWLDRLPPTISGVVLMNEVLDAIAPHVVARRARQWFERGVVWRNDQLMQDERPLADTAVRALAAARFPVDGDYVSEVNPAAEALVTTLARRVDHGAVLIVDYGFPRHEYYVADRRDGTLVGHYRHRMHTDPLLWPGLSDLTAHVDFTAIAEAGERAGARVAGFATQAAFLLGCGILELLDRERPAESARYLRAAAAVEKLLSPAEMGELFKVMLLERGADCPFLAVHDMTDRLSRATQRANG
jgi:SAM-dependent MidA family methyltransferase